MQGTETDREVGESEKMTDRFPCVTWALGTKLLTAGPFVTL